MKRKKTPSLDLENIIPLLISIYRRHTKEKGPEDRLQTREFRQVVEGIKLLQEGKDYTANKDLLSSYLLYNWVIHYQQAISLLGEVPTPPKRVLDVCSGLGPFAFASLRYGASDVISIDRNGEALALAGEICGRWGFPLTVRSWDYFKSKVPVEGSFDLIIVAHSLHELFPVKKEEEQLSFIQSLLNRLTPQGFLLVVDNSYPEANSRLLRLRDKVVEKGVAVQAPCVFRGPCPALNSACYAQREMEKPYLIKEFQRAAQINLSSLKMSYILFKSPQALWTDLSPGHYRVISPPFESFQGKRFYLCGQEGKKQLGTHMDPVPLEAKAFEYLKRGELISIEGALEKPHALDIIEGTKISIKAACGKAYGL